MLRVGGDVNGATTTCGRIRNLQDITCQNRAVRKYTNTPLLQFNIRIVCSGSLPGVGLILLVGCFYQITTNILVYMLPNVCRYEYSVL